MFSVKASNMEHIFGFPLSTMNGILSWLIYQQCRRNVIPPHASLALTLKEKEEMC